MLERIAFFIAILSLVGIRAATAQSVGCSYPVREYPRGAADPRVDSLRTYLKAGNWLCAQKEWFGPTYDKDLLDMIVYIDPLGCATTTILKDGVSKDYVHGEEKIYVLIFSDLDLNKPVGEVTSWSETTSTVEPLSSSPETTVKSQVVTASVHASPKLTKTSSIEKKATETGPQSPSSEANEKPQDEGAGNTKQTKQPSAGTVIVTTGKVDSVLLGEQVTSTKTHDSTRTFFIKQANSTKTTTITEQKEEYAFRVTRSAISYEGSPGLGVVSNVVGALSSIFSFSIELGDAAAESPKDSTARVRMKKHTDSFSESIFYGYAAFDLPNNSVSRLSVSPSDSIRRDLPFRSVHSYVGNYEPSRLYASIGIGYNFKQWDCPRAVTPPDTCTSNKRVDKMNPYVFIGFNFIRPSLPKSSQSLGVFAGTSLTSFFKELIVGIRGVPCDYVGPIGLFLGVRIIDGPENIVLGIDYPL